ncbi:MAG TPA: cytochrome c biogenesis protein CcsA [Blastocatellia bacterium]|nr:cytochrome c biogenesis protein CcsA [Blastocatellia bacterium]
MSRAISREEAMLPELELSLPKKIVGLWPIVAPIAGTILLIGARIYAGRAVGFLYGEALILLALVCYISAAVVLVTNLFVKEDVLDRLGLISVSLGYCFNLTGWMIRWVEAGDKEGWKEGINGVWRYYPLDNLYALTLGFCAGAALATLVVIRKPKYRMLGALSMPILVVVLTLGMMLGSAIQSLPPILDSYWRPIHVSIATVAYGVCLLSFGLAFAYLLKDGIRSEAVAIGAILYGVLVLMTVGAYSVPFHGQYTVNLAMGGSTQMVRAELPMVGPLMVLTLLVLVAGLALLVKDFLKRDATANQWGWRLFRTAAVLQAIVLIALFYQLKNLDNPVSDIPAREYQAFSQRLAAQQEPTIISAEELRLWAQSNSEKLKTSVNSNPVEFGGLLGLFVVLLLVSLFSWKRDQVTSSLPSLKVIDGLLYRTVGVAFPLLSLLLITGAVWANESWGRYWGWDSKEVGALVAWMAYAGFLHTRIAHGWRGRRSAYFALLGFALVIFTWLGVSFLLPGLHSYAGV